MIMTLAQFNKRYGEIIHADLPNGEKNRRLAALMTEMEREFKIPVLRNEAWEKENKAVIALYRKISMSRTL